MCDSKSTLNQTPRPFQLLLLLLLLLSVAAFKNAMDEAWIAPSLESIYYAFVVTAIWMAVPGAVAGLYVLLRALRGPSLFLSGLVLLYLLCICLIYFAYALNGPSDPDTAGHMHLLLVPIGLGIVSFPLFCLLLGMTLLQTRSRWRGVRPAFRTPEI